MTFNFTENIPSELNGTSPILISGEKSQVFSNRIFLITNSGKKKIFEIKFEYYCSPFRQAIIEDQILAVGFEENFYLFDVEKNRNVLVQNMSGYFGHLYFRQGIFYVADADGIYCIAKNGNIIWENKHLGIDGVIINDFFENKIYVSGEWDPPGGWRDFVLDLETGKTIQKD